MKIFHGPNNVAGAAGVLAKAQRELGFDAEAVCYGTGTYGYKADRYLKHSFRDRLATAFKEGLTHDVFHFYFGQSLTGDKLFDVPWLRRLNKKIFFYFCGCDLRDAKSTIRNYQFSACKVCWPAACSANRDLALATAQDSDGVFVSTPDLLEFVDRAVWLPQPLDMERFDTLRQSLAQCPIPDLQGRKLRVVHGPSSRILKGTRYLEEAIAQLQAKGRNIELVLVENMSHADAMQLCLNADIVVDQLLIGAYGQFSVEMMALGKPVICYIRDDLRPHYPADLPIVSATPENIGQVVDDLSAAPQSWADIGAAGMAYVRNYHDAQAVARIALRQYGI
ncbi:glycosyltransferase [Bordetella genomosp. 12]|uniref:Glycosyl transferase family 1 domain-containing protein n=1 Tax=Bordetella genomosp. 12 TaxID=463035 RepID=A0A261VDH0_9BORD|nr:glycosyltransferase [Bordetella genomosp. 12]OZI72188.1 hypothetical protein CAL22_20700 [Bordetella genomosp. 12]